MPYNNPHIKGWLRVILVLIAYLFVAGVFQLIGVLIADVDIKKSLTQATDLQRLIVAFSNFIGLFMVLWGFLKIVDNESFFDIGLSLKNRVKDIWIGLILGLIIMGFALLFLLSVDEVVYQNINLDFEKLIFMFCLFVLVSLTEELLFRGYILKNFMYSFNKPIALILSSLLFSIVHGLNPNFGFLAFIDLFFAGILLGISYTYTKNLWFPIALHFSWNFFQSLFGFKVSGLDSYSLIHFEIPENNLINGGEFGFEGSILSIIIQIIVIIQIYFIYNKKAKDSPVTSNQKT